MTLAQYIFNWNVIGYWSQTWDGGLSPQWTTAKGNCRLHSRYQYSWYSCSFIHDRYTQVNHTNTDASCTTKPCLNSCEISQQYKFLRPALLSESVSLQLDIASSDYREFLLHIMHLCILFCHKILSFCYNAANIQFIKVH